jgi:3'-5' exoribonuclease
LTNILINQIKPGNKINSFFALRSIKLLPLRGSSGSYLALVLGDRTGQMEGRAWDSAQEIYSSCRSGDIVNVTGQAAEYNGKLQIQVSAMSPCPACEIDPARFIPSSKIDAKAAKEKLHLLIESIRNNFLKDLLTLIFSGDLSVEIFTSPAARRNHHAAIGGLIEHSLGMAESANKLAEAYAQIDRDLLITGTLLHDIGKIEEYSIGTGIDFTDGGRLLGHIVIGVRILENYIDRLPGFPSELKLKLLHMVVSHHGQYEWQSPKRPKFLEAAILHHLDMLDMLVDVFSSAVESRENPEDHWTGWVKGLDRFIFCK